MRSNWFWIKIINVILIVGAILFYNQAAFYHRNAEDANKQLKSYADKVAEANQSAGQASGSDQNSAAAGPSKYKDGTYSGSAQGYGGTISLDVTVEQDYITDIQVTSASGETDTYFNSAVAVIDSILNEQTPDVDSVAGATLSSNGIINAVKSALEQAEQ